MADRLDSVSMQYVGEQDATVQAHSGEGAIRRLVNSLQVDKPPSSETARG